MTEGQKRRLAQMLEANDFSKVGNKKIEMNKADFCQEISKRLGSLNLKTMRNMKMRDLVRKVLTTAEEVQAEALMRGANSIVSLNGKFYVKQMGQRPMNMDSEMETLPPRSRVVFAPGARIKRLNDAFKVMAITKEKKEKE